MFNKLNQDGTTPSLHSLELFERKLVEELKKTNEKKNKEVRKSVQAQTSKYPLFVVEVEGCFLFWYFL